MVLTPLFVIHGLKGSNVYATYSNAAPYYFCPKSLNNEKIWGDFTIPNDRCIFYGIKVNYNEEKDKFENQPNYIIEHRDNGMVNMKANLEAKGYIEGHDLFMLSYDWRVAPFGLTEKFYPQLKSDIEKLYNENNTKSALLGYSLGSHVIRYFLDLVGKEWTEKYISKVFLMAPAFAGNAETIGGFLSPASATKNDPKANTDILANTIKSMPGIMILLPNTQYYGTLFNYTGMLLNATSMDMVFSKFGLFNSEQQKVYNKAKTILTKKYEHFGVPTYIYYNSGINTTITGFSYSDSISIIYGDGDGTVPSHPLENLCNQWKTEEPDKTTCLNADSSSTTFSHSGFEKNEAVAEAVFNFVNSD
jgi:hypothetical protein